MGSPKMEALVLRTNASGRVVGLNARAQGLVGCESLGLPCHLVIRGTERGGTAICREDCAAQLASGQKPDRPVHDAVIRGRHVSLRCFRVGDETVVVADPVASADKTERLTNREREVLSLVARGLASGAIASELGISTATVRTHVEHARGRLGASTRAEAVVRAIQTGQLARTAS